VLIRFLQLLTRSSTAETMRVKRMRLRRMRRARFDMAFIIDGVWRIGAVP
jgi:hypothetical protein